MLGFEPKPRDADGDRPSVADGLVRGREPQRRLLALGAEAVRGQAIATPALEPRDRGLGERAQAVVLRTLP